ncbi:serine--tRNA ligase [bacterium]|nr:serine--tRNA ligase [candidate division CSSED10-310 bacterium]
MIDLKMLRNNPDSFTQSLGKKRYDPALLAAVLDLDARWRELRAGLDEQKALRNSLSKVIPRAGMEERAGLLVQVKDVGDRIKALEPELKKVQEELDAQLIFIPNPPHPDVPDGYNDADNELVKTSGEPTAFTFTPKDHQDLGEANGWLELQRAARAAGSRFSYLMGRAVFLQLALIRYAVEKVTAHGFLPVVPPVMVREHAMFGTGFFPAEKNEIYKIQDEDHYLVGTSEVSLAALHQDEIIPVECLPLRYCGISTCFRREAGTYGKDTRGIFRVHQFDKIEMFTFCLPEDSSREHERILAIEEEIIGGLGLPYRVMNICAGELGAPAAKKYDIEVWLPGQQQYRELTSCSNCTDFQARRLGTRTRLGRQTAYLHTLNGTATAIGRTLIAIMENYQQADGAITIPPALEPYMLG